MSNEWTSDINVVSGGLKLWFRELPEPLLTYGLYNEFIEAARKSLHSILVTGDGHAESLQGTTMIDYGISAYMDRSMRCPTQITRLSSSSWDILTSASDFLSASIGAESANMNCRVRRLEGKNQMSISNLSIVFGPTLLGAPPEQGGLNLEHMSFQCKVRLSHTYRRPLLTF